MTTSSPTRSPGACWPTRPGRRWRCRRRPSSGARSPTVSRETPLPDVQTALRRLYRDRLLVLAALDVAPTVENEPVLPFAIVGVHLSDMADAALAAALDVAVATVCKRRHPATAAGRHRDGQMRCAGTELRQRRRRHLRGRRGRRRRDPGGRRDDAVRLGHVLRGRRGAATRRQARPAGAHPGFAHRLLPALGQDLGVPGPAEGQARRRRRPARREVHGRADADGVDGMRARGLRPRRAGDAPAGDRERARRRARPRTQARHRRAAGRRIRRSAAATRARPQRSVVACDLHRRRAGRTFCGRLHRPRRRRQHDGVLRIPAAARAPPATAAAQADPHAARPRRRRGAALARARRACPARRSARRARGAARGTQTPECAGVAAAREALLSAAARIGRRVAGTGAGHVGRGRRTPARGARLPIPAQRADSPCGPDQSERAPRSRAGGTAAHAAGLAVGHPRSRRRPAGVPQAVRGDGRAALVPRDAARRERGGQAADARAGHLGVRAGSVAAGTRGHPVLRRRTHRPQAPRHRPRERGQGPGDRGRSAVRPGQGDRVGAHACAAGNWPGSRRPICSACSTSATCARR